MRMQFFTPTNYEQQTQVLLINTTNSASEAPDSPPSVQSLTKLGYITTSDDLWQGNHTQTKEI